LNNFNPKEFTKKQVASIKDLIGDRSALIAVSGGVDSITAAILTHKAIGNNLLCVMLDDAFMRENEPQHIANIVSKSPIELPIRILDVQERFILALEGLKDAEEKRLKFRKTFYQVLSEVAKEENSEILVQGTIKADIVETTGGVKTQHNVLEQIGINTVQQYGFKIVEPLTSLYKEEVRMVARHLGLPSEITERQPFPGPGLSVRIISEITKEKLDSIKRATTIVEAEFAKHHASQYFAAILDNKTIPHSKKLHIQEVAARLLNIPSRHVEVKVFDSKATGVKGGNRRYGRIAAFRAQNMDGSLHKPFISKLITLQTTVTKEDQSLTRVLYTIKEGSEEQPYALILRAINTHDFITAKVSEIPWVTLNETAEHILAEIKQVSAIYYDVTTKPPATIEME